MAAKHLASRSQRLNTTHTLAHTTQIETSTDNSGQC